MTGYLLVILSCRVQIPINQPVRSYAPGSSERKIINVEISRQRNEPRRILPIIGGKAIAGDECVTMFEPHAHSQVLGQFDSASNKHADMAVKAAIEAKHDWSRMSAVSRRAIFLRAADLLAGPFNEKLVAATMLQQSKTVYQSEIDASAELIDFLRFNVAFSQQLEEYQPISVDTEHNRMELRPLDGFVFAASPFNFTAIAGNLCLAPALMGNTVVWKPSERSIYSASFLMELFEAAGLPPGVINMLPTKDTAAVGATLLNSPDIGGVHFTGSTATFNHIWRTIGTSIECYKSYPRIVGETGGKDFVLVHKTADIEAAVTALTRGAFDYQGQKCSAASRAYIPQSLYADICERLAETVSRLTYGDVSNFQHFMGAVIDERAYKHIVSFIDYAVQTPGHKKIAGDSPSDEHGYFIPPTVIVCEDPYSKLMIEEIFGPILAIYVYPDSKLDEVVTLIDCSTPYALTGAIFAKDQKVIDLLSNTLRDAAGNFYINDKPTGAVVGRQPFGGGRRSGTNDKAGGPCNLLRWVSPRTIKENTSPPKSHTYLHMA